MNRHDYTFPGYPEADLSSAKVLITGAGTVGTALAEHIIRRGVREIQLIDHSEYAIFRANLTINAASRSGPNSARGRTAQHVNYQLCDIRDLAAITKILQTQQPDYVFHTAAIKHVDLAQTNPLETIKTNIAATANLIQVCNRVNALICFISTDKAASPSNMLGWSKRIGEQLILRDAQQGFAVRFPNIYGASGSVIETWEHAIASGQQPKLTDPMMERYFFSAQTAASFILRCLQQAQHENTGKPANDAETTYRPKRNRPKVYLPVGLESISLGELYRQFQRDHNYQSDAHVIGHARAGEQMRERMTGSDEQYEIVRGETVHGGHDKQTDIIAAATVNTSKTLQIGRLISAHDSRRASNQDAD